MRLQYRIVATGKIQWVVNVGGKRRKRNRLLSRLVSMETNWVGRWSMKLTVHDASYATVRATFSTTLLPYNPPTPLFLRRLSCFALSNFTLYTKLSIFLFLDFPSSNTLYTLVTPLIPSETLIRSTFWLHFNFSTLISFFLLNAFNFWSYIHYI